MSDQVETDTIDAHYDVIIIGAGSGNSIPSPAYDDLSIAIVESGRFGGTCMNVGCIPTKMFVLAADAAQNAREASRLGVHATVDSIDWKQIQDRVFTQRVDAIADGGEAYRRGDETPNITVYDQHGSFVGPRTIRTGQGSAEKVISGDQVIIAAGARPVVPDVVKESGVRYRTNEDIMRLQELPKELIVLGAGFIACEFAHVFSGLGTKVHLVNRSSRLLRKHDADISSRFTEVASTNWDVHLETLVESLEEKSDGRIIAKLSDGTTIEGDELLVATGRTPNGDQMNVASTGVALLPDGRIDVDTHGFTGAEGVWALGDVSSPHQLKHVANHEAKVVFHNVLATVNGDNELRSINHDFVPAAVFSHPQVGAVGMTEDEARDWAASNGTEITIKVQNYGDVAYGWALEDKHGICKLIADKQTGQLLGAHFLGEQAATLVHQCIQMMAFGIDCRDAATNQYWIHPALPEVLENALLGLEF